MSSVNEPNKHNSKAVTLNSIDLKLAVLDERLANSLLVQTSINVKMEKHIEQADKRLRDIDRCNEAVTNKAADNKDEIDRMRNKSNLIDILLAVGTAILGALGINNK